MPLTIKNIINNIAFTTSHEVDEICKPLQEFFGIDFFAYEHDFRNINDDRITASSYLCSNPQALEFAFSCPKLHHEDQQLQKRAERYYFLENRAPVFVNQLGKTCNVRYIFCRSDHLGNNETDFFAFGTSSTNPKIMDNYVNNRDLLDKFILYFQNKADKLIKKAFKERIIFDDILAPNYVNSNLIASETNLQCEFLQAIQLKHQFLINKENEYIPIPRGEIQCLQYLARGRSAKAVAQILGISSRTVETNWIRSKNRLNCFTKKELLDILEKNNL